MNVLLVKQFKAEAAIGANLIVKHGAADDTVVQSAAATDKHIGVCDNVAPAINERVDVITHGIADLILGGAVTRGDLITSDANGKGVVAAPAAGVNNRHVGIALMSGVLNDVIPVLLSQGSVQG
jgi:hypothetical protein